MLLPFALAEERRRADASGPAFGDVRAAQVVGEWIAHTHSDKWAQNEPPLPPPLLSVGDYPMPKVMLNYTEEHFHYEDMSAFLKTIEPELQAELTRFYIEAEGGAPRLWPEGAKAYFVAAKETGLDMRGVCLDLNTIAVFHAAGFKVIAMLAFALHLLNPHNAAALDESHFSNDTYSPKALHAIKEAAKGYANDVELRNWGCGPNRAGVGSLDPNELRTVSKLLVFFGSTVEAAQASLHDDGKGAGGNTRAGLCMSAAGAGSTTGGLCVAGHLGESSRRCMVMRPLEHGDVWAMDKDVRCENMYGLKHGRYIGVQPHTSAVLMAEGPPDFQAALAEHLPMLFCYLNVHGWCPPEPKHDRPRGWWGEAGKKGGVQLSCPERRAEGAVYAMPPRPMYALAEVDTDEDEDEDEPEPAFVRCFGSCPAGRTRNCWCRYGTACCDDAWLFDASYCRERATADLINDLEYFDSPSTGRTNWTKQYKLFRRLALAGIYETATDRKVNDILRLGSTSELLARQRGKNQNTWEAKPVVGAAVS